MGGCFINDSYHVGKSKGTALLEALVAALETGALESSVRETPAQP